MWWNQIEIIDLTFKKYNLFLIILFLVVFSFHYLFTLGSTQLPKRQNWKLSCLVTRKQTKTRTIINYTLPIIHSLIVPNS